MSLKYDNYHGIEVGDTVERVDGTWHGHNVGWVGIVISLENGHLRFGDGSGGHSPAAHIVIKKVNPIKQLISRTPTQQLLRKGGRRV